MIFVTGTIFVSRKQITKILKTPLLKGKRLLEPFASFAINNNLPFKILEDTSVSNEPELHVKEGDLWFCLEGEVDFTCGGSIVNQVNRTKPDGSLNIKELTGTNIKGGASYHLIVGDWLWIPPGIVHQHIAKETARLIIIKIPQVTK